MAIETIKRRADFLAASAKGKKFVTGALILFLLDRGQDQAMPRIGYTVTKKVGNAVERNRIKRRLRAAVQKIMPAHAKAGYDYVLIARRKAYDCPFADLLRDMEFAFSRIATMKDTPSPMKHRHERR